MFSAVNARLEDISARRSLVWVQTMARIRKAKVVEVAPGEFYVFEADNPGNRFPLVGSVKLQTLVNYFEGQDKGFF